MRRQYFWPLVIIVASVPLFLVLVGNGRLWGGVGSLETPPASSASPFFFRLELDGEEVGDYSECSGLGSSNEIVEDITQMDGGVAVKQKTPGALEWHNITLKRIAPMGPSSLAVWSWRKAMENGDLEGAIRNGAITLGGIDPPKGPMARWEFRNAWVAALSFDGSTEEMMIVHEGLERMSSVVNGGPPPRSFP